MQRENIKDMLAWEELKDTNRSGFELINVSQNPKGPMGLDDLIHLSQHDLRDNSAQVCS